MVKNTHGGSGNKKFARKNNTGGAKSNRLRVSEDEGELYAIVTKILGNGMFHCHCIDDTMRLGHIRGKFSIRKRDNFIEGGKWVLIGLREWDVPSVKSNVSLTKATNKTQQCDLLEVYSDSDKQRLVETMAENWKILDNNDISKDKEKYNNTNYVGEDQFVFATDRDIERQNLIQVMKSTTAEKIILNLGDKLEKITELKEEEEEEKEVNFDDI